MPFSFKSIGDGLKKAGNSVAEASKKAGQSVVSGVGEFAQFLSIDGYLNFSADTLQNCIEGKTGEDLAIPVQLIQRAKGIVFMSEIKAGFVIAGKGGIGMMMSHLEDGSWSGPVALAVGGLSGGAQIGASTIHSVLLLNTKAAVDHFASSAQVRLGAGIAVAAGPVGRDLSANVALSKSKPSPIYSYSFSQGLFAGASLEGAVLSVRWKENNKFYGTEVTSQSIIDGKTVYNGSHAGLARIYDLMADLPPVEEMQLDLNTFLDEKELVPASDDKQPEPEPEPQPEGEDKEEDKEEEPLSQTIVLDPSIDSDDDAPKPPHEDDDDAPKPAHEDDDDAPKPPSA